MTAISFHRTNNVNVNKNNVSEITSNGKIEEPLLFSTNHHNKNQSSKNQLLYDILTENLENKCLEETVSSCIKQLKAVIIIVEAHGNMETARKNLQSNSCNFESSQIDKLITLFQNRNAGCGAQNINRTAAKYVEALKKTLDATIALSSHLNMFSSDDQQRLNLITTESRKWYRGDYIQNVTVAKDDNVLNIQLGRPNGTMGSLHNLRICIKKPSQDLQPNSKDNFGIHGMISCQNEISLNSGDGLFRADIDENIKLTCVIDSAGGGNDDIASTKALQGVLCETVNNLLKHKSYFIKDNDIETCKNIFAEFERQLYDNKSVEILACASFMIRISNKTYVIHCGDTEIMVYGNQQFNRSSYNLITKISLDLSVSEFILKDSHIVEILNKLNNETPEKKMKYIEDLIIKFEDPKPNHEFFTPDEKNLIPLLDYYKLPSDPGSQINNDYEYIRGILVTQITGEFAILCSDGVSDNFLNTSYKRDLSLKKSKNSKTREVFFENAIKKALQTLMENNPNWIESINDQNIKAKCDTLSVKVHEIFLNYIKTLLDDKNKSIAKKDDTIIAITPLCDSKKLQSVLTRLNASKLKI